MRSIIYFVSLCCVFGLSASYVEAQQSNGTARVEKAVGAVIVAAETSVVRNKGAQDGIKVSRIIVDQANALQDLSQSEQCDFFWCLAMTLELDGGYRYEFCELVNKRCRQQFLERAKALLGSKENVDQKHLSSIQKYSDAVEAFTSVVH